MDKPFLTINEQLELLSSRGMTTDSDSGRVLMREGYYSVVNGYKAPFLDHKETEASGDDRYRIGTSLADLHALFSFDRSLRDLTFRFLIKAEATVRTAVAYCFSEAHRGPDDYLLQSSYCTKGEFEEYQGKGSGYAGELSELTSKLGKIRNRGHESFLAHYRASHDGVPLWVLANAMTFGNLEHFFNLMKPAERAAACRMISASTGRLGDKRLGFFDVDEARVGLEALVKFRNVCAHDERLYCAKVGGRKNIRYPDLVWFLERYLTRDEFSEFETGILELLESDAAKNLMISAALKPLGFPELQERIEADVRSQRNG